MPLSWRPRSLSRLGAADRFGDVFPQPGIPKFRISDCRKNVNRDETHVRYPSVPMLETYPDGQDARGCLVL